MKLNKVECKVLHLGRGDNLTHQGHAGSLQAGKQLCSGGSGVLVDNKLTTSTAIRPHSKEGQQHPGLH